MHDGRILVVAYEAVGAIGSAPQPTPEEISGRSPKIIREYGWASGEGRCALYGGSRHAAERWGLFLDEVEVGRRGGGQRQLTPEGFGRLPEKCR